jgi:hypothetical protein
VSEPTPEQIIDDSIREFCHDHDEGICKPDCYACFQFREGKRALDLQREQIAALVAKFRPDVAAMIRQREDLKL